MDLKTYFSENKGPGILATANAAGRVDVAVYARPHVQDDNTVSFIMRDRLSHSNLQANPHAAFMYLEEGTEHHGVRLYLTRTGEDSDPEKISAIRRRTTPDAHPEEDKFLVTFQVDKVLAAVGTEDLT